ncbi:MAG: hypothetical protein WCF85_10330 [Rhodospirillaceae bacterium]
MGADWTLIIAAAAGLSLAGVIGLTVLTGLQFQREAHRLIIRRGHEATLARKPPYRQAEIAEAEARLSDLHKQVARLEQARRDVEQPVAPAVASDRTELEEAAVLARRREVETLEDERQSLADEVIRLRDMLQIAEQGLARLNDERQATEQRCTELVGSFHELRQRREALTEDEAAVALDLKAHRIELATLQRELQALRDEKQALEQQVDDQTVQVHQLGDDPAVSEAAAEVERLRAGLTEMVAEIAVAEARRAEIIAGARELEQRREALSEEVGTVQHAVEAARAELVRVRDDNESALVVLADARAEIAAAAGALEQREIVLGEEQQALNRDIETARAELERLREDKDATVAELEVRRAGLTAGFNETRERHAALVKEVEALDRERHVLAERVGALRSAVGLPALSSTTSTPVSSWATPSSPGANPGAGLPPPPPPPPKRVAPAPAKRPLPVVSRSPLAFLEAFVAPRPVAVKATASKPNPAVKVAERPPAKPAAAPPARPSAAPAAKTTTPFGAGQAAGLALRSTMKAIDVALSGNLFGPKPAAKRPVQPKRKP